VKVIELRRENFLSLDVFDFHAAFRFILFETGERDLPGRVNRKLSRYSAIQGTCHIAKLDVQKPSPSAVMAANPPRQCRVHASLQRVIGEGTQLQLARSTVRTPGRKPGGLRPALEEGSDCVSL